MLRPSRLYLPRRDNAPSTILEHLLDRFPQVGRDVWRARVSQGLVTLSDGTTLSDDTPYRHGLTVFYRKEVPSEPLNVETPPVVFRDDEILIVDKPHGMSVTPTGSEVKRSLLALLEESTGLADLSPIHRLDRETAGLLLLAIRPASRARYHRLFAENRIRREYVALAQAAAVPAERHWRVANRIVPGDPWYRQRIGDGPVNAITEIELVEVKQGFGQFRLLPETGKKHQLRVHMASMGFPIVGDPFYPEIRKREAGDPPLQLLACRLAFTDPITGIAHDFSSTRTLIAGQGL